MYVKYSIYEVLLIIFVLFDSLSPSQQFFCYVGTGLPVLNEC